MNLFIKSFYDDSIICPFKGVEWDGTLDNLREIIKSYCVKDSKVIPFIISVLNTQRQIIFNHKVIQRGAPEDHIFFLFDNKVLLSSGKTLSEMYTNELKREEEQNEYELNAYESQNC